MRLKSAFYSFLLTGLSFQPAAWAAEENTAPAMNSADVSKILDIVIEYAVKYSFQAFGGVVILFAAWIISNFVSGYVGKLLSKGKMDVTVQKFIQGAVKLLIMLFAAMMALGKFGVEITPLIAGLSVVGVGVGLALQGTLSNYAAGVSLIFTKPFKVGDIIEVVGVMGEIQDMELARTVLKTLDGTLIFVPNKHIIGEIIHNYSDLKRVDVKVGVNYKADIDKAISVLQGIIRKDTRIAKNHEVKVGISEFADSSVNLYARVWCKQSDYWDVMFSVNRSIFDEFNRAQIEIPYPQRDVHIKSGDSARALSP